MRAALHRAAKTGNPDRGRDLADGCRHARHAAPRSGAHASRWCIDELPERAPRPPRLRAERRAGHNSFSSRTRVGPSELYGYDAHGNVTFLTDGSGNVTDTYSYDAWGNLLQSGTTINERLYAQEDFDPDLGLINLRARSYNPSTGRFLTVDPLDSQSEQRPVSHRYLYAQSDPVNLIDPNGREVEGVAYTDAVKRDLSLLSDLAYSLEGTKALFLGGAALGGSPEAASLRQCVTTALVVGKAVDFTLRPARVQIGGLLAFGIDLVCENILIAVTIDKERGTL